MTNSSNMSEMKLYIKGGDCHTNMAAVSFNYACQKHRIMKYTEGPLSGATCRLLLCKNYAVSGQKAEQPASTACLLAVLLINMHLSCWSNGGQHA